MMALMTRRATLTGGVALFASGTARPLPTGGAAWQAIIRSASKKAIEERTAAGLTVTLIKGGVPLMSEGFGYSNLETRTAANIATVYRIASITKPFTAAAIMLLRERRLLTLEDSLDGFYPAIPKSSQITVRHLLTHTSGLHDYARGGLPVSAHGWSTADEFAAGVVGMDPLYDFPTGSSYSYSNTGYVLLGGIIEKIAKVPYARFLADNVFKPLGMKDTAVDDPFEVVRNRAQGYVTKPDSAGGFRHAALMGLLPFSAGALRSTSVDLGRWASGFFGGRLLPLNVVREMTTPARVSTGALVGDSRWWPPGFDPGSPPPFAKGNNYGLGWEMTTFYGRPTFGHSGGISGFNSILTHYPRENLTLIMLSNTENGAVKPWVDILERSSKL